MALAGRIESAFLRSLREVELSPQDEAGAKLARQYAITLDTYSGDIDVLKDIGPKLLAALTALGMTPAGRRGVVQKAVESNDHHAPADELAALRAARGSGTR